MYNIRLVSAGSKVLAEHASCTRTNGGVTWNAKYSMAEYWYEAFYVGSVRWLWGLGGSGVIRKIKPSTWLLFGYDGLVSLWCGYSQWNYGIRLESAAWTQPRSTGRGRGKGKSSSFFLLWCSYLPRQIAWLKWTTEAWKVKCWRRFDYGKDCRKAYSRLCYLTSISFTLDEQLQSYQQTHIKLFKSNYKKRDFEMNSLHSFCTFVY